MTGSTSRTLTHRLGVAWLVGRAVTFAALFLVVGGLGRPAAAGPASPQGAFVVTSDLLGSRLRVFGEPGDLAIRNRAATAIVRKSDGWLVDFWPNDPTAPTAPQLKGLVSVDGLWHLHPVVHDGRAPFSLVAKTVRANGDAIETVSDISLGAGTLEATTSYRFDGDRPRLIITTTFKHRSGGRVAQLFLGDQIKWGNVDYFVEGRGRAPSRFSGPGRWIGRKGAAGDLKLSTLEKKPMRIDYKALHYGLQPAIRTSYVRVSVDTGESVTVQRALAYEPILLPTPAKRPTGTLEATVTDEHDKPLAAKLSFRTLGGMPDPNFGNDGDETGVARFVWSGTGRFRRDLRAGKYRVLATAGIERDAASWEVEINDGQTTTVAGKLPRVVKTPGRISADLHLHQVASVDADIACSTRVISIAAEGVEFVAATDHYVVTDYAPTVKALQDAGALASPLLTVVGSEVSTVGNRFGHFNLYPMQAGTNVDFTDTTPKKLFAEMRAVSPKGILQVNHPRWDKIGYFHRYKLDPKSGRLPAASRAEYDAGFDAIEIFNGLDATSQPKIRTVLYDWIHLLGLGHRYTATGNSDSHKLAFHDPGLPRNLIRYGTAASDDDDVKADPDAVIEAIRRGNVLVTSGPIVDVDIHGVRPGGTVSGRGKRLPLHIKVRAAPWIDVREVEVLLGGQGRRVRWIPVKASSKVERLDTTFDLVVPGKTFIVVYAKGVRDLPNVYLPKVKPVAITNPIWIEP